MPGVTGREIKVAFQKFVTNSWGVAASVTKGIYFQSDGGLKHQPEILADDSFGQTFIGPHDVGDTQAVSISLSKHARYTDNGYILTALAMGSPVDVAISTSVTGQTTSWRHVFDLSANIDGLGATVAFDKVLYTQEVTSAKIHGWDLEDGDGGVMRETFRVMGSRMTVQSSTNINSTLANATYPTLANRIIRPQGVLRLNVNTAGALASTDAVTVSKAKFSFTRPQDAPNVFGQSFIAEPADSGFPEFTLELEYPRMSSTSANSLEAGLRDATAFKGDWTFTGPTYINSTDRSSLLLQWPYLQLTDFAAPTANANQVKPVATFAARMAPTSPTGMAFVNPLRVTRVMQNSVNAFA